jgi:hypothetical protein
VQSPLRTCVAAGDCDAVFGALKTPYYIGDDVGLTQTVGWVGAWTYQPSVYALAAETTAEVAAAIGALKTLVPQSGSYFAESSFYVTGWQSSYSGENCP